MDAFHATQPLRLFVTILSRLSRERMILEVPRDEPIQSLLLDLNLVLGWKEFLDTPPTQLGLETEDGKLLSDKSTLCESGVLNSERLYIVNRGHPPIQDSCLALDSAPHPRSKQPEKPISPRIPILSQPFLRSELDVLFLLEEPRLTIGRSGFGYTPDIDLTEWDRQLVVSRKHAVLEKREAGYCLLAQSTTNGIFVNGVEIFAGAQYMLHEDDRIQFGFHGLELIFHHPTSLNQ